MCDQPAQSIQVLPGVCSVGLAVSSQYAEMKIRQKWGEVVLRFDSLEILRDVLDQADGLAEVAEASPPSPGSVGVNVVELLSWALTERVSIAQCDDDDLWAATDEWDNAEGFGATMVEAVAELKEKLGEQTEA